MMDSKIYFRPAVTNSSKSLKEYAYSSDKLQVTYHQRLMGRRHQDLQKMAKLCNGRYDCNFNDGDKTSQSLYETCIRFVLSNLSLVESFEGLPSPIAEEIFTAAVSSGQLSKRKDNKFVLKLQLFTETYGLEVLSTLGLCNKGMFLAKHLDELAVFFPFLQSITLSNCDIGNEHDVLFELGKLCYLKYLNLSGNRLKNAGIKNLLQAQRRGKLGLDSLEYLNLSQNYGFTSTVLNHIAIIPSLKAVSLTICKNTIAVDNRFSRQCKYAICHSKELDNTVCDEVVGTGWGYKLIKKWLQEFEMEEESSKKGMRKLPFYASKLQNTSGSNTEVSKEPPACPALILCLCESRKTPENLNAKKRKSLLDHHISGNESKKANLESSLQSSLHGCYDVDILQIYMQH